MLRSRASAGGPPDPCYRRDGLLDRPPAVGFMPIGNHGDSQGVIRDSNQDPLQDPLPVRVHGVDTGLAIRAFAGDRITQACAAPFSLTLTGGAAARFGLLQIRSPRYRIIVVDLKCGTGARRVGARAGKPAQ